LGNGIRYLLNIDKEYPQALVEQVNSPVVLYFKGSSNIFNKDAIAIVGSRKMTSYGKEVASRFSSELSTLGVVIVSGLARGIDTTAHGACVESGGKTIAVLAGGLDNIYPRENEYLAREIIKKGGVLVSEYPLGHPAFRENFPNRNRIISGLAKAVLVVEGEKNSGTLLTAKHAGEQGKTVFAVPGQITSPLSQAPHYLIRNGASIAFDPVDLVEELDLQLRVDKIKVEKLLPTNKAEEKILKIIANEPLHLDEIVRLSSLALKEVSSNLTIMELKGIVKNVGKGVYKKS